MTDTGDNSFSGTGLIGFNALSGSGLPNAALDNFSFTLNTLDGSPDGQLPRVFAQPNLATLAWNIDPTTFALLGLNLDTNTGADGNRRWDLSIDTYAGGSTSVTCYTTSSSSIADSQACYAQNDNPNSISFTSAGFATTLTSTPPQGTTPAVDVPEPGTLGLLGLALGAMGFSIRRRSKNRLA